MQKRVLAIHDISCVGKCSLTVALPIISALGIEVSVLPTSVLSTHTGGFKGYTFRDLTNDLPEICNHWKSLGIHFDAIYTGYLGSEQQVDIVCDIIDTFKSFDTVVIVDPVMADNGKLYALFNENFPSKMAKVCSKANIIIPNITESCMLLNREYLGDKVSYTTSQSVMEQLSSKFNCNVVLTGVSDKEDTLGAAFRTLDSKTGVSYSDRIEGMYHGSGDVFASSLVGALIYGRSLEDSVKIAVEFTCNAIKTTHDAGTDTKYGVNFEKGIMDLINNVYNN